MQSRKWQEKARALRAQPALASAVKHIEEDDLDGLKRVLAEAEDIGDEQIAALRELAEEAGRADIALVLIEHENGAQAGESGLSVKGDPFTEKRMARDWSWEPLGEDAVCITSYRGSASHVHIPSRIGQRAVRELAPGLFDYLPADVLKDIREVEFPGTLRTIPTGICSRLPLLKTLRILNGVRCVEDEAFRGLKNVERVELPDSLESIGTGAFRAMTALREVVLPKNLETVPEAAFFDCSSLESVQFKEGTRVIGPCAFGWSGLREIVLPPEVRRVEQKAFQTCMQLRKAELGADCTYEPGIFRGCRALETVKIPEGVHAVSARMFAGCSALQSVDLPPTVQKIDANAFAQSGIEAFSFPDGAMPGTALFAGCHALRTVRLPEALPGIPARMFSGCTALTEVDLPVGLRKIGKSAFRESGLRHLRLPDSLRSMEEEAFEGCKKLESVESGASVSLPAGVFRRCSSLSSVQLPNMRDEIGEGAFRDCSALEEIDIGAGITCIGYDAFAGSGLRHVCVPKNVRQTRRNAFRDCLALRTASIFGGCVDDAFVNCVSLEAVQIYGRACPGRMPTFAGCSDLSDKELCVTIGPPGKGRSGPAQHLPPEGGFLSPFTFFRGAAALEEPL